MMLKVGGGMDIFWNNTFLESLHLIVFHLGKCTILICDSMVSENNLALEGHLEAKIFNENMKLNWNFVGLSSGKGLKTGEGTEYR